MCARRRIICSTPSKCPCLLFRTPIHVSMRQGYERPFGSLWHLGVWTLSREVFTVCVFVFFVWTVRVCSPDTCILMGLPHLYICG
jgi:hypothetical protein